MYISYHLSHPMISHSEFVRELLGPRPMPSLEHQGQEQQGPEGFTFCGPPGNLNGLRTGTSPSKRAKLSK